ncbi:hypothetical protein FIU97_12515 [Roseivivax sp. THAF40]|uniref:hypothetical protein n=1 Tax=Roseivivax sp. THAF40 TaxID=2587858 RepID=UPI0012679C19|nr:hypothetical protein [Roseivivax sp. THAF40]QFT47403.1 hypothetical protein FIU97_12515 [Roseivivax sp. THAF40]
MSGIDLLEMIWGGFLRPATASQLGAVSRCVDRMLPAHVLYMISTEPNFEHVQVVKESDLVEQDLPLADVLAEEFDIISIDARFVVVLPAASVARAVADGREAELAGAIVAGVTDAIEKSGFVGASTGRSFVALWHCYDTLTDLGLDRVLGVSLARFMAGFVSAARCNVSLADKATALVRGRVVPDPQSVQNGALLKSIVISGANLPMNVLSQIMTLPAHAYFTQSIPAEADKVGGL